MAGNYPGWSWGEDGDTCPFNVIEGALGWLLVDTRSDLIIAKSRYGSYLNHKAIFDLATLLNYGTFALNPKVLHAMDLTA